VATVLKMIMRWKQVWHYGWSHVVSQQDSLRGILSLGVTFFNIPSYW
jgi:hypothetical protein